MTNVHYLKIATPIFKDVKGGMTKLEVRKDERNYEVGDTLILDECDPETGDYKRGWIPELITYKIDDPNIVKVGSVILGIEEIKVDGKKNRKGIKKY